MRALARNLSCPLLGQRWALPGTVIPIARYATPLFELTSTPERDGYLWDAREERQEAVRRRQRQLGEKRAEGNGQMRASSGTVVLSGRMACSEKMVHSVHLAKGPTGPFFAPEGSPGRSSHGLVLSSRLARPVIMVLSNSLARSGLLVLSRLLARSSALVLSRHLAEASGLPCALGEAQVCWYSPRAWLAPPRWYSRCVWLAPMNWYSR